MTNNKLGLEVDCVKPHCRCMQIQPCNNHHYKDCQPNWGKQAVSEGTESAALSISQIEKEFDKQIPHTEYCLNFPGRDTDRYPCRCEHDDAKEFIRKYATQLLEETRLEKKEHLEPRTCKIFCECGSPAYNEAIDDQDKKINKAIK